MSARLLTIALTTTALLAIAAAPQEKNQDGKSNLVTKVYQVTDLVTPMACCDSGTCTQPPKSGWAIVPAPTKKAKARDSVSLIASGQSAEKELIQLIKSTICPEQWCGAGGPCSIEYHPLTMAMVVHAPPHIQELVTDLFAALRHLQQCEAAIELHFVTVADSVYERLMTDFELKCHDHGRMMAVFDDDKHVYQFMEACQGDLRTHVMQAPKITMFNGQTASCRCCEEQQLTTGVTLAWKDGSLRFLPHSEPICLGLQMGLETHIVQNRGAVKLDLKIKHVTLDSDKTPPAPVFAVTKSDKTPLVPVFAVMKRDATTGQMVGSMESYPTGSGFPKLTPDKLRQLEKDKAVIFNLFIQAPKVAEHTLEEQLTVGDGKTAVLFGWDTMLQSEHRLPVLSDLPCLGQLFRQTHPEPGKVLVLVTPRVIAEAEETHPPESLPGPGSKAAVEHKPAGGSEEAEAGSQAEELLAKYHKACAAGKFETARKIAIKALKRDPACFDKKR